MGLSAGPCSRKRSSTTAAPSGDVVSSILSTTRGRWSMHGGHSLGPVVIVVWALLSDAPLHVTVPRTFSPPGALGSPGRSSVTVSLAPALPQPPTT
jgi:hypothetical protein